MQLQFLAPPQNEPIVLLRHVVIHVLTELAGAYPQIGPRAYDTGKRRISAPGSNATLQVITDLAK